MEAVEKILNYIFRNKSLLKEALTHTSCPDHPSYERLEFVGDSAIGLAISNYLYLTYPSLEPHELSLLRAANVSTEKLARVALSHGLYRFLRCNAPSLDDKVIPIHIESLRLEQSGSCNVRLKLLLRLMRIWVFLLREHVLVIFSPSCVCGVI